MRHTKIWHVLIILLLSSGTRAFSEETKAEPPRIDIGPLHILASATSWINQEGQHSLEYHPHLAMDGNVRSAWAMKTSSSDTPRFTILLDQPAKLVAVNIATGVIRNWRSYLANARPRNVSLLCDGTQLEKIELPDFFDILVTRAICRRRAEKPGKPLDFNACQDEVRNSYGGSDKRIQPQEIIRQIPTTTEIFDLAEMDLFTDTFPKTLDFNIRREGFHLHLLEKEAACQKIELVIDDYYKGTMYNVIGFSELQPLFRFKDQLLAKDASLIRKYNDQKQRIKISQSLKTRQQEIVKTLASIDTKLIARRALTHSLFIESRTLHCRRNLLDFKFSNLKGNEAVKLRMPENWEHQNLNQILRDASESVSEICSIENISQLPWYKYSKAKKVSNIEYIDHYFDDEKASGTRVFKRLPLKTNALHDTYAAAFETAKGRQVIVTPKTATSSSRKHYVAQFNYGLQKEFPSICSPVREQKRALVTLKPVNLDKGKVIGHRYLFMQKISSYWIIRGAALYKEGCW
jgi:hypothetical protein